jgi:hypothetical protein
MERRIAFFTQIKTLEQERMAINAERLVGRPTGGRSKPDAWPAVGCDKL